MDIMIPLDFKVKNIKPDISLIFYLKNKFEKTNISRQQMLSQRTTNHMLENMIWRI